MAQFRATIQGGKGEVSRLGHKTTGIRTKTNGWNSGVYVFGHHQVDVGDVLEITATRGSNGGNREYLGWVDKDAVFHPSEILRERIIAEHNARLIEISLGAYLKPVEG